MKQTRSLSEFSCLSEYTRLYPMSQLSITRDDFVCYMDIDDDSDGNLDKYLIFLYACSKFLIKHRQKLHVLSLDRAEILKWKTIPRLRSDCNKPILFQKSIASAMCIRQIYELNQLHRYTL